MLTIERRAYWRAQYYARRERNEAREKLREAETMIASLCRRRNRPWTAIEQAVLLAAREVREWQRGRLGLR